MTYSPFLPPNATQFGEQIVAQNEQQVNLKSSYGISALRDITAVAGSGTVTSDNIEYRLQTTASGTDSATIDSAERGRYLAGQDALAGIGVRCTATPTGSQKAQWGYFDDNDGFGYGYDATGLYVFRRRGGSDTITRQASWNGDKLDGTGESGFTLTPSDGYIYRINFAWYGYGSIEYKIFIYDTTTNKQEEVLIHRDRVTGSTSIENPNLPIRAEVSNGGTASALDSVYVGGRQFAIRGGFDPQKRTTAQEGVGVSVTSSAYVPIVSLRRKSTGHFGSVSIKPQGFDFETTEDVLVEIRDNSTLTTPSYATPTDYTASETALEADTASTSMSGGEVVWKGLVVAAGLGSNTKGSTQVPLVDVDLVNSQPMTLCAKAVSTTATVSAVLRLTEEW